MGHSLLATSLSVSSSLTQDNSNSSTAQLASPLAQVILESLQGEVSSAVRDELKSLAEVEDVEIVERGLLGIARQAESTEDLGLSTLIYQNLSEKDPPEIQAIAQERMDASLGKGRFRDRVDHFLGHLASETLDPVQIAAMLAGVGAFRAMRNLSGLRASERLFPTLFKTGQAQRMLPFFERGTANLGALSFSALAATVTERAMQGALDRASEMEEPVINLYARNVLRYTLMFGAGSVAGGLNRRFHPGSTPLLESMVLSGGIFLGAVAANKFERMLGVRAYGQDDAVEDLADGMANLAHFWIGRGISTKLGGRRFLNNEVTMFGPGLFTPRYVVAP